MVRLQHWWVYDSGLNADRLYAYNGTPSTQIHPSVISGAATHIVQFGGYSSNQLAPGNGANTYYGAFPEITNSIDTYTVTIYNTSGTALAINDHLGALIISVPTCNAATMSVTYDGSAYPNVTAASLLTADQMIYREDIGLGQQSIEYLGNNIYTDTVALDYTMDLYTYTSPSTNNTIVVNDNSVNTYGNLPSIYDTGAVLKLCNLSSSSLTVKFNGSTQSFSINANSAIVTYIIPDVVSNNVIIPMASSTYVFRPPATFATIPAFACFHPDTLIQTSNGYIPIKNIKSGDQVINQNGKLLEVMYNIKYILPSKKFVKISKNAFGQNLPLNDFLITPGHPLIINGEEIESEKLINNTTIYNVTLDEPVNIYSICTKERTGIITEGLFALTWQNDDWEKNAIKTNIMWIKANE